MTDRAETFALSSLHSTLVEFHEPTDTSLKLIFGFIGFGLFKAMVFTAIAFAPIGIDQ